MNHKAAVLPISVLIPTMNRPDTLQHTLESYMEQEFVPGQIVVVDQSQRGEIQRAVRDIVRQYEGKIACEYIYQQEPSLTKARNRAMEQASHEIVICSDDDIEVERDTLYTIYSIMQDSRIAMIAGLDANRPKSRSKIGYLLGTKSFAKRKIGHVTASMLGRYPENVRGRTETQWAMGYFFVIRKSCAQRWNLQWDEHLPGYAYAEDLDFSYGYYRCARAEQLKCILDEKVQVRHLVSGEYRVPSQKSTCMYVLHRAYLCHKYQMGAGSEWALRWCNFWIYVMRCLHRESPQDMKNAMRALKEKKEAVLRGEFAGLY